MAAVFKVVIDVGGSDGIPGSSVDVAGGSPAEIRFKTDDDGVIDTNDPVPIATALTKRSYWKSMYIENVTPPNTSVSNIKWFSTSAGFQAETGVTLQIADQTPVNNSGSTSGYGVATGTPGDSGDEVIANHGGGAPDITSKSVASVAYFDSANSLAVSITEAGAIINAAGEKTDYVVAQVDVIDTATPGTKAAETFTWQYDEI